LQADAQSRHVKERRITPLSSGLNRCQGGLSEVNFTMSSRDQKSFPQKPGAIQKLSKNNGPPGQKQVTDLLQVMIEPLHNFLGEKWG
jgi:hypothetical protein